MPCAGSAGRRRALWRLERWLLVGAAASALVLGARSVRAAPAAGRIEWQAPRGCPDLEAVYRRLSAILGYEPESLGHIEAIRARIDEGPTQQRLTLEVLEHERESSRLFWADSCETLADAAALAIALAIRAEPVSAKPPVTVAASVEHSMTPADSNAAVSRAVVADQGSPDAEARPAVRHVWSAAAAALLDFGALPEPALGLRLDARLLRERFVFGLYGVLLPPQELPVRSNEWVEFGLLAAGLQACYAASREAFSLRACACFEGGRFSARGVALGAARSVGDPWLAAGAALELGLSLTRPLELQLGVVPLVPLLRKQYAVNGTEAIHASGELSARLYLGLEFSTH